MNTKINVKCKYIEDYNVASHTTFKIGGNAEIAFFPATVEELLEVISYLKANKLKCTIIGAGSNLLVSSKGICGGVIFTTGLSEYTINKDGNVSFSSGLKSAKVAKLVFEAGFTGLEFLIGIPGSLGGAVIMNSSAHGQAIKDFITGADVLDIETCEIAHLTKEELKLDYRGSFAVNGKHLVLKAYFKLNKEDKTKIQDLMTFHVEYRQKNHPPITEANAGSTFRNPKEGVYTAKLLQELGARGSWSEGDAIISDKHGNFVTNRGNASSLDIARLMFRMFNEVKNAYGYELIAEVRNVGEFTQEEETIWKTISAHK
ncbi:MAG: UDP-N-acetylmuramate dehydrogenase [bacterium]